MNVAGEDFVNKQKSLEEYNNNIDNNEDNRVCPEYC